MQRQRLAALRAALTVSDAVVTAAAFVVAGRLRFGSDWYLVWDALLPRPLVSLVLYALVAVAAFWLVGLYRLRARWTLRAEARDLLQALLVLMVVTFSLLYLFKLDQVSRLMLIYFFVLEGVVIAVTRTGLRWLFRWLRRRGRGLRHMLIVGSGEPARRFLDTLVELPELGAKMVGFVGPEASLDGIPRLGTISDLADVLAGNIVDDVAICLPFREWGDMEDLIRQCETQGKTVRIPATSLERMVSQGRLERVGELPVLTMSRTSDRVAALAMKRVMDVVGALVGLVLSSPLLLVAAAAILIEDGQGVLFSQTRVGHNGRRFRIYKLRTMVTDAETHKVDLLHRNERTGPVFKVSDDPRITKVGGWLRRASIDEIPQFWNVLRGEMSLVGPRPPLPEEVNLYDPWHRARLAMKPGITGLWQVKARRDPDFDAWVQLDLEYIDRWSLTRDLGIVGSSVREVLSMSGR